MQEKYEQRRVSGDIFDDYVAFLSGDLCDGGGQSIKGKNMEVSYTKEQQKQRQKQQNKNKVAYNIQGSMALFQYSHFKNYFWLYLAWNLVHTGDTWMAQNMSSELTPRDQAHRYHNAWSSYKNHCNLI